MNIALSCDHAGFALRETIIQEIKFRGHNPIDLGTTSDAPVDYPDFAAMVAKTILSGKAERGIILCGSGIGACITANKFRGIRAGTCHNTYSARQGVEHDAMNVLCMGARIIGPLLAQSIVAEYLNARFSEETRHVRRVGKISAIEDEQLK
ncbi:MAG: ribose 5-phosphate isomerase B [bacterium]